MNQNLSNAEPSYLINNYSYTIPRQRVASIDPIPLLDYGLSLLLLICSLPILLLSALWITLVDFGSPLYFQPRVGFNGRLFTIIKLRTMRNNQNSKTAEFCKNGDKRIIFGGNFLRKTRIDEMPQFINILLGDMALVGPRPEQEVFVAEFKSSIDDYDLRHTHKPGITGMAQVRMGYVDDRNGTRKKLKYDLLYIRNRNFRTWLFVVFNTFKVILCRKGR